mgnify:CR=1 FL=1
MTIVVCIDNKNVEHYLTVNKYYEVLEEHKCLEEYTILCDQGFECFFNNSRFITLYDFRKNKLLMEKIHYFQLLVWLMKIKIFVNLIIHDLNYYLKYELKN